MITFQSVFYMYMYMYVLLCHAFLHSLLVMHFLVPFLASCSGGYGYVFVAQDTQTGKEYALKVLYTCTCMYVCV